ncbi:hypothetical protein [Streptomyces sp. WMMB 322]|uniref:hypothetical protein n=1 Tax=Streptomyces sp. WMMB 322 TaxID=1286821 RepID=UPI0006E2A710|nr:hypothetical protein [Streptomyces sp. WMMB 322]SCK10934.1 hypothetical protein H180DRAFT_00641 [Streptomyces sp. WMMB 322]
MSPISLLLLATAVTAAAVGGAALHSARGLRRRLEECEQGAHGARVPRARSAEEIRSIVVEAIAEERERELAEARAVWASQDSGTHGADEDATLAGRGTEYEIAPVLDALLRGRLDDEVLETLRGMRDHTMPEPGIFVPRQMERGAGENGLEPVESLEQRGADDGQETPDVAAARRRHPSEPDFTLRGEPAVPAQTSLRSGNAAGHERTVGRLAELADARTPLSDVRQGPLGTLDVYLFQDGTTVCLSPGHRETAEALCAALREGDVPVLMGGSTVSGAYALTFAYGEGRTAYLLADRVIASR